ncbi:MAG: hypothetical protein K2X82_15150 [Gemmataceae bacterium]|nr:hypothetical protein [Gemmataceae bacterium]
MTKSPRAVAQEALRLAKDALPAYTSARSRKDFTSHQSFAVLALKTFLKTDYRGIAQLLTDLGDLRNDLGLEKVPRYSALCYAAARPLKKGRPSPSSAGPPRPQPIAA